MKCIQTRLYTFNLNKFCEKNFFPSFLVNLTPNFRGHCVSHERKFRGHLKKSRAKSPFFEGQGGQGKIAFFTYKSFHFQLYQSNISL